MIKSLKIRKNSKEDKILLFKEVSNLKKINILFGGNGVGKSTFLNGLKENSFEIESKKPIKIFSYTNSLDNKKISKNNVIEKYTDIIKIYNSSQYSEGQAMIHFFRPFLLDVEDYARNNTTEDIVVLIDEMDSGLSIENINMLLHLIVDMCNEFKNIQFFISTNHYHYTYVFKEVLNMYDGTWIRIESYEEYFQRLNEGIQIFNRAGKDFSFLDAY